MTLIPPKYEPKKIEEKWRNFWEEKQIYKSSVNKNKIKYSVVIPPPNVTGILHIGHILNNTIQDIYCRWKRMCGYEVCWVPGMDHAGIATQIMVEKEIAKKGKTKYDYGRDEFIKLIWQWKDKHGGIILKQLRMLGVSVDWSKERFTLDKGLSKAVNEVFVDLYKKGLIYRGKRIINWDPVSQTALSDDEIEYKEIKDKLYYIKYPFKDIDDFITIATTRPETMFGDTAVAVNPEDKRYKHYKNRKVILPLVNKEIPVIFDDYVDMEFGTGALKITPAHDANDFEVGQRHNLEIVCCLTKDSKMNEYGMMFKDYDIFKARKMVVSKLREVGLLVKEEDYIHNIAIAQKSEGIIEPYLSDQWFVSMKKLAEPALKVVKEGLIKFYPERYTKVYYHWLENIKDWCISRQLWWGHQIPIWYNINTNEIYCDTKPPADIDNWIQDDDVLDTWFSSWLWPFSVFGWENSDNDKTNESLKYYYPTDFLNTAADIIFLWVARMIMAGLEYMGKIPFKDVYFHSIVRDGKGRKMSKTLGNSPDPIDVMDKYGTDALRFTIVYLAPLGNDVLFDVDKTEIGRNFITKLWNAGRFLMLNKEKIFSSPDFGAEEYAYDFSDKWILSRFNSTLKDINVYLNEYRLNDYTKTVYNFVWSDFCDWYIEFLKIKISEHKNSGKKIIDNAVKMYEDIIKILHPVIPYATEEIWHLINDKRFESSISFEKFPELNSSFIDENVELKFEELKEVVTAVRNLKSENNISFKTKCNVVIKCRNNEYLDIINHYKKYISVLCNLDDTKFGKEIKPEPDNYVSRILSNFEIYIILPDVADLIKIREKYEKELDKLENYRASLEIKLSNNNFLQKASPEVIEKEKFKLKEVEEKMSKLRHLISLL